MLVTVFILSEFLPVMVRNGTCRKFPKIKKKVGVIEID